MQLRSLNTIPKRSKTTVKPSAATAGYEPTNSWFWQHHRDLPPFSFATIHQMLLDGEVSLSLSTLAAPIQGTRFAFKKGEDWIEGIKAKRPEVGAFVLRQIQRFWNNHISEVVDAQAWGWSAGEVVHRLSSYNLIEFD